MKINFFLLFSSFLLGFVQNELIMVVETFRHGAREVIFDWWNAQNFTHWGELTTVGMRQHYNLGQILRKIYIEDLKFLSPQFNPDEMRVRSSDYNRTIVSALSQLYGFYPLGSGPKLPDGLDPSYQQAPFEGFRNQHEGYFALPLAFQPIPIHTVPISQEFLLRSWDTGICKVSSDLIDIIHKSEIYQQWEKEFKPSVQQLGRILNLSEERVQDLTIYNVSDIFDVFMDDLWAKKPIPENIPKELWTNLTLIYNFIIYYSLGGIRNISQFYASPFLKELIQSLDSKLEHLEHPLKWKMYSAHDWSVATFATALNITDYQCARELITTGKTEALNCFLYPDFATNMIFELHKDDDGDEPYIKIRYNGNYVNLCERKEQRCGYSEFKRRVQDYIIDNFEELCNRTHFNNKEVFENKISSFLE